MSNIFVVVKGPQINKNLTSNGVTIGGDAAKSGKNTRLLVTMCVRLSQKLNLHNLTNQTRFKKVNG